jgi:hypothetical protein
MRCMLAVSRIERPFKQASNIYGVVVLSFD